MYALKTTYAEYNVSLSMGKYSNGRTAMTLIDTEDGAPVMVATVNVPETDLNEGEIIIKNYGENEGVLEFLVDNGITSSPVRWITTGWVKCPVVNLLK